jgi:CO/xanthine dehydrogenase FAD-binding subunit
MATVGGNLFVEQPYGDLAVCLIALGASASISGAAGTRIEAVETLVRTGVKKGEIVTQLSFALPAPDTFKFVKATRRAYNSAAIVTVAAVVKLENGRISDCSMALGGVAKHPVRAKTVEKNLAGKPLDRANIDTAAKTAKDDIDPFDDAYASAWYRARVTPVHIRRALIGE